MSEDPVRWPRVQELLRYAMVRWEARERRPGLPGIHGFDWETPSELANDSSMGQRFIEPGLPGEESNLVIALRKGFGIIPRMPMNGPFLRPEEIDEIVKWIDSGMHE